MANRNLPFDYVLLRSLGMLELCVRFILTGEAKGVIATRLKELVDARLRDRIRQQYEPDEILHELVLILHKVWKRYRIQEGDFAPYLVSCFHFEVYQRFRHLARWDLCAGSADEVECIIATCADDTSYANLDSWTFCTPALQVFEARDELILRMRYIQEYYVYEIADHLGVCTKTIQRSLARSRSYILSQPTLIRHATACGYI